MKTKDLVIISIFAAITGILSQIAIPLPFSPVPFTMQTIAVTLSGLLLGSKNGFMSQLVYILMGIVGMPVFAGFSGGMQIILGPTGGFILAFPFTAFIIGYVSEKSNSIKKIVISMFLGLVLSYFIGAIQLSMVTGISLTKAIMIGVLPFIVLDILKIIFVSLMGIKIKNRINM